MKTWPIALALLSYPPIAFAQPAVTATQASVTTQLPRTVRPTRYDVTITPDAGRLAFTGDVRIAIEVLAPTSTITLNQADLTVAGATLATTSGQPLGALRTSLDNAAQTATFTAQAPLAPGTYVLSIAYAGTINQQASGLFALDYADRGVSKRALFTQFENSDARRFVPSWDEPFYKAVFSLKAIVPAGEMAVGNLPVATRTAIKTGVNAGKDLVSFGDSPRMSSYLLFFALGDFERATVKAGGAEIGLITKRGDIAKGRFALDSAAAILPWYNEYFGTPFPLPKLDNIAAPGTSQFFSAMENWGAIFYFERALLLDPRISSEADRQTVFVDVAHEMAHQWFGDLVTMTWWDDLWLNEGFATWMETRASAHFHPEWRTELGEISSKARAMDDDALITTHPVVQRVATVDQASQAFDNITYQKGEAVIAMLEGYTGADGWRDGVRAYMKTYAHQNTVTDDLWRAIEAASGKPITQIAHEFTLQPGVPLIRASSRCVGRSTQLRLDQGEFTKDRPGKTPLRWHVPVTAASLTGTPVKTLVDGSAVITLPGCDVVVVNAGQTGYFRTLYTPAMTASLTGHFASVAPIDQLAMLDDSLALGLGGVEPLADTLAFTRAVPADADPQVVSKAIDTISALISPYSDGVPVRKAGLMKLATAKFLPVLTTLGWTPVAGEPVPTANLRNALITFLGKNGEPSVVAEANRRFAASVADPAAIPASVRRSILYVVATNADAATWDKLHANALAEPSSLGKADAYALLGAARDPALADRALALALSDEPPTTTGPVLIRTVAADHPDRAFGFAIANQKAVTARLDSGASTRFIPRLAADSHERATMVKLQAWGKANVPPDAMRAVDASVAQIGYRIEVRDRRMGQVDAWLKANGYE